MHFLFSISRFPLLSLIHARGEMDDRGAHLLLEGGEGELQNSRYLVVDVSRVTAIAGPGLKTLVSLGATATRRGGWTWTTSPSPAVRRALAESGLDGSLSAGLSTRTVCRELAGGWYRPV
ncbi:STAS domain-containing protein [Kineococcus sp. SYSU DK003]|uniref:STAS domain-containing protein n=1 Tax=Kineococcus sp. SYSU DK003 TaxID=3383124 RepID=UPI003D7EBF57